MLWFIIFLTTTDQFVFFFIIIIYKIVLHFDLSFRPILFVVDLYSKPFMLYIKHLTRDTHE